MGDPLISWRGLVLGADGSDIDVHKVTGWDDLDDLRSTDQPRARAHGDHTGDVYAQARIVTVTGEISSRAARNALAGQILAASAVSSALSELTVTTFGRTLTANARLIRRSLPVADDYASGSVPFALAWRCPNPRLYGPATTLTTGLPTSGGGLSYPIGDLYDYGALGATGQLKLTNPGSEPAAILLAVRGGLEQGFEASAVGSGQRLLYPSPVPPGQLITLDTATGRVLAEGTADRRGQLTVADWLKVPAADPVTRVPGELTLQFTSLGGVDDPERPAKMSATWKPTYL